MIKQILITIIPIVAFICAEVFTPWDILRVWIKPLPDTVQEQVNNAIKLGIDGSLLTDWEQVIYSSVYEFEHT